MLKLEGLIAATYTPFDDEGNLKLAVVKDYTDYLADSGMSGVYICGSTGEGVNLTLEERKKVAEAFIEAVDSRIPVIVQVGANCLRDCMELASHAQSAGAAAVSSNAPSYFKISDAVQMIEFMSRIASAASKLPFYYYHIPGFTGANIDLIRFMELSEDRIPNLAGIKYSDIKVYEYQEAMQFRNGKYGMLWGCDEMLLSALVVGSPGGVGSTYAQIPHVYHGLLEAWNENRMIDAQIEQLKSIEFVKTLNRYGNLHSAQKAVLKRKGFDFGRCRLPIPPLDEFALKKLHADLDGLDYFM